MSLKKLISPKSDFSRNVLTLMTGTSLAQVIPVLVAPLITRFYSPFEFGVFNMIAAFSAILGGVIAGRYELAILLPKSEQESDRIGVLALLLSLVNSLFLLAVVHFFGEPISELVGEPAIEPWLYSIPALVFFNGIYQTFIHFVNRDQQYKPLAGAKIGDGLINSGFRVFYGWLWSGVVGLVSGTILGQLIGIVWLGRWAVLKRKFYQVGFRMSDLREVANKYSNFPRHMVPSHFLNVSAQQSPHFLLVSLYGADISGFFGLMYRVVKLPVAVIASAFTDVFKQQAAQEYRAKGHFRGVFFQTLRKLFLIATGPFLILFLFAPDLFAFVFSEEWRVAGVFARYFTLPIYLNFVISPLTSVYFIAGRTNLYMRLQVLNFFLVVLAFIAGAVWLQEAVHTVGLLALAYSLNYVVQFVIMLHHTRSRFDRAPDSEQKEE